MKIYLIAAISLLLFAWGCKNKEAATQTTAGGFKYIMHKDVDGPVAQPGDVVFFHATVRKPGSDSIFFDTRVGEAQIPSMTIPAADEQQGEPSPIVDLLRVLSVGDSATVIYALDSLPSKPPGFEDVNEMYYDIVVVEIKTAEELAAQKSDVVRQVEEFAAAMSSGTPPAGLQTSESGLKYLIVEQGSGTAAEPGNAVSVNYYGALPDGTLFDTSYDRGTPLDFSLGDPGLIPGWTEGVDLLNQGGKALLYIPFNLGYGDAGFPPVIPAKSDLIFYISLESVN